MGLLDDEQCDQCGSPARTIALNVTSVGPEPTPVIRTLTLCGHHTAGHVCDLEQAGWTVLDIPGLVVQAETERRYNGQGRPDIDSWPTCPTGCGSLLLSLDRTEEHCPRCGWHAWLNPPTPELLASPEYTPHQATPQCDYCGSNNVRVSMGHDGGFHVCDCCGAAW